MEKRKTLKKILRETVVPSLLLIFSVLLSVIPGGCRTSIDGVEFLSGDFTIPQVEEVQVVDASHLSMLLSKEVSVNRACVKTEENEDDGRIEIDVESAISEDGHRIDFNLAENTKVGGLYVLEAELEDSRGNTLTLSVDFKGFNDRVPVMAFSEIRTGASASKSQFEFVELYVLKEGNTSGLSIVSAADGLERRYQFPAIEVKKGERIVVHYRNYDKTCVDETGENLLAASAEDCSSARDLFMPQNEKSCLGDKTDVIFLKSDDTKIIYDAVVYLEKGKKTAFDEKYTSALSELEESGIWTDANGNAVCSADSAFDGSQIKSAAHSVNRKSVTSLPCDGSLKSDRSQWYDIGKKALQTPGKANSLPQ